MRVRNPFKRSVPVPAEVTAAAGLRPGERVLAGTETADGTWLVGTHEALHVVVGAGSSRIPWERIERADWDGDEERFVVSEVGEYGHTRPRYAFPVSEPGLLLQLVRERVTASVILQRRVPVEGRLGLVVVARRAPAGTGEIAWAYEFDAGVDPEDPAVMAVAEAALRAAQSEVGR